MRPNNMPRPFAPEHSELDAADEIERLRSALRYEQHRRDRIGTHGPNCHAWGPAHYECAMREIDGLRERIEQSAVADAGRVLRALGLFVPSTWEGKVIRLVVEEG